METNKTNGKSPDYSTKKFGNFFVRFWQWDRGLFLIAIGLFIWFLGFGSRYLYLVPVGVGTMWVAFFWIYRHRNFSTLPWELTPVQVGIGHGIIASVLLATGFLKLYSFQWNILDVGSYSASVYNLSQGNYYNSFMGVPALADHFTPSLAFFAPLYRIYPTVHWITIAKLLAYVSTPLIVFHWLSYKNISLQKRLWLTILFGVALLLLYRPSVYSLQFEFSPSVLAIPLVMLCFMWMEQKKWFLFLLGVLFILGLKEHLGVILIGFGLYQIAFGKIKSGIILTVTGTTVVLFLILYLMPWIRELSHASSGNTQISLLKDPYLKAIYLIKLFLPIGFLPVYYWRYGIMAAPAIGINLISARPTMYSGGFHYNDVSSVLLLIALLQILIHEPVYEFLKNRIYKTLLLISVASTLFDPPASPGKVLRGAIPSKKHLILNREIFSLADRFPQESMLLQSGIGPHIHRKNMTMLEGDCKSLEKIDGKEVDLVVISQECNTYLLNLSDCLKYLDANPDYQRLPGYQYLIVFQKKAK